MFGVHLRRIRSRFGEDRALARRMRQLIGSRPGEIGLYKLALIHKSASLFCPDGRSLNNERLEYLGDAIIEAVVSDYLYVEYPSADEGYLTQLRSKLVSRAALDHLALALGLDALITAHAGGMFAQKHIGGDALEALVGAVYLDKGYRFVRRLLLERLLPRVDLGAVLCSETDPKSRLIEWCQKGHHTIVFRTDEDPESTLRRPLFRAGVVIDDLEVGHGMGGSKKEAEQNAACSVQRVVGDEAGVAILERYDRLVAGNSA